MKRLLTLLLALTLLLSLCVLIGCDKEAAQPNASETGTPGENEAPDPDVAQGQAPNEAQTDAEPAAATGKLNSYGEDIRAMLDAGEEVLIGLSFQGLSETSAQNQNTNLTAGFEEKGFTVTTTSSEGVVDNMITQMENLVSMGAKLIVALPPDADSVTDITQRAMAEGTYVVFMGLPQCDVPSGGSTMDWVNSATLMGEMAIYWAEQTFPDAGNDGVHMAVATFMGVSSFKLWSETVIDTINASEICEVTYTKDGCVSLDMGFTFAEEALTTDASIRGFVCWMDSIAFGASNYVMSQPDLDYAEYGAFGNNPTTDSIALMETSKNNEAIYRGGIKYGYNREATNSSQGTLAVSFALLFGEQDPPYWAIDKVWSVDVIGFDREI